LDKASDRITIEQLCILTSLILFNLIGGGGSGADNEKKREKASTSSSII